MKCNFCDDRDATIHVHQILGTERFEYHLCEECAVERGIKGQNISVPRLFKQLRKPSVQRDACPACGTTKRSIQKSGNAGCATCYEVFRAIFKERLIQHTGFKIHSGALPARLKKLQDVLHTRKSLQDDLQQAVHHEDYEKAAKIRDQLNSLSLIEEEQNES
jgi:protein arginine kinase activator